VEGSNGDWNQTVSIELLSSDDMDNIINQLVAQGYLTQKTRNESEFKQALSAYQTDNNLQVTGELDRETLCLLFNNQKGR
jgi:N-acetyl-anhydromuramyl-L-alanine amidase AmpD